MVSFQCEGCGDVVTKKKLDAHVRRCYAPVSCIDCMTTFHGNDHKSHTSCISEAQKYEGALYKEKKPKGPKQPHNAPPSSYKPPTVEDASSPPGWDVAKVDVPPPAPSPPRPAKPVNVFDFMVNENDRSPSASSFTSASSVASPKRKRLAEEASDSDAAMAKGRKVLFKEHEFVYGDGPVEKGQKYNSNLSLAMETDTPEAHVLAQSQVTPAPRRLSDIKEASVGKSGSEKKRKRPPVEELDLSDAIHSSASDHDAPAVLHSGLTGGLAKLLGRTETKKDEASPLSPKKRSKHLRNGSKQEDSQVEPVESDRRHRHKDRDDERRHRSKKHRQYEDSEEDDGQMRRTKTIEGRREMKAIEYHKSSNGSSRMVRKSYQSNSEFFLSLVDKDHKSHKGQSIWGALKTFHEGMYGEMTEDSYRASGTLDMEQKRLMKGLRMKLNKSGEIVLFSRPDFEIDQDLKPTQKRIGAG